MTIDDLRKLDKNVLAKALGILVKQYGICQEVLMKEISTQQVQEKASQKRTTFEHDISDFNKLKNIMASD